MPTQEIEIKYLATAPKESIMKRLTFHAEDFLSKRDIEQFYLSFSENYCYISKENDDFTLTVGMSNSKFHKEFNINEETYNQLQTLTETNSNEILPTENTIRARLDDGQGIFCIKGKSSTDGLTRTEIEFDISRDDFEALRNLKNAGLHKSRYCFKAPDNKVVELDVFKNNLEGLILAEIEFESVFEARHYDKPTLLAEFKDVTTDFKYTNQSLAINGLPNDKVDKKNKKSYNRK